MYVALGLSFIIGIMHLILAFLLFTAYCLAGLFGSNSTLFLFLLVIILGFHAYNVRNLKALHIYLVIKNR